MTILVGGAFITGSRFRSKAEARRWGAKRQRATGCTPRLTRYRRDRFRKLNDWRPTGGLFPIFAGAALLLAIGGLRARPI